MKKSKPYKGIVQEPVLTLKPEYMNVNVTFAHPTLGGVSINPSEIPSSEWKKLFENGWDFLFTNAPDQTKFN